MDKVDHPFKAYEQTSEGASAVPEAQSSGVDSEPLIPNPNRFSVSKQMLKEFGISSFPRDN